jgi:O-antigen/teichoic acid export membrane protein
MLSALFIGKTIGIVYIIIRCKIPSFVRIKYFDKTALKELLKYSLPMVPNTLCWWIVNLSDRLIITSFLGAGANGIYAVANKFPTIFTSFAKVFQMSWTENAAESNNSEDRDNYFSKIMNQSVSIIVCICACILAALPLVFRFLVNSKYSESYINILILLIAAIFSSWSSLYVSLFGALKYTKTIIFTTVFAAVVNVAVNFIFINKIGLIAASLSTLAAYLLITVLSHILISKKAHIKYKFSDMLIAFSALGVCAASYCIKNIWLSLVITVLVGALTVFKNKNIIIPIFNKTVSPVISKIKK